MTTFKERETRKYRQKECVNQSSGEEMRGEESEFVIYEEEYVLSKKYIIK